MRSDCQQIIIFTFICVIFVKKPASPLNIGKQGITNRKSVLLSEFSQGTITFTHSHIAREQIEAFHGRHFARWI